MSFKKTDAGWFSNQSGLEAVRRGDGEVFARTFEPSGRRRLHSRCLIVQRQEPPDPGRGAKVRQELVASASGDVLSTSGTLAPMTYLFAPRNIRPIDCFKQVRSGSSHQTNLVAVANGQLDVATNNSTSLMLNRQNGGNEADRVQRHLAVARPARGPDHLAQGS